MTEPEAKPLAPVSSDLPVEQDQIEFTRNVDPATTKPSQLQDATVAQPSKRNSEPAPTEAPAMDAGTDADQTSLPPAPAKNSDLTTDVDGTRTNEPVVPTRTPARQAAPPNAALPADPAPASAPKNQPVESPASPAATQVTTPATEATSIPTPPDHEPWDQLLRSYVDYSGNVNYKQFKQNEEKLDEYLNSLANATPNADWSREASMAYWINAYNAFTIKRILNDYPLKSIQDLDGGDPWKVKWIELDGKSYSLNNIEHDILRPNYGDARIHFAVNCAAASCPPLPNRAFTADNLDKLLETNTRAFIRNTDYNQTSGKVAVSKIFTWYAEDFGDLKGYLNEYLATPIAADQEIGFRDYDWSLNEQ